MKRISLDIAVWTACLMVLGALGIYYHVHQPPSTVEAAATYPPRNGDPCTINLRVSVPINLTASGQMITGVAGKQTYICALEFVTAAAQNIALVEGTGATCGTATAGMAGGNTAALGWNLALSQEIKLEDPGYWTVATATAGDSVCLLLSGVAQTSGFIDYVQM